MAESLDQVWPRGYMAVGAKAHGLARAPVELCDAIGPLMKVMDEATENRMVDASGARRTASNCHGETNQRTTDIGN